MEGAAFLSSVRFIDSQRHPGPLEMPSSARSKSSSPAVAPAAAAAEVEGVAAPADVEGVAVAAPGAITLCACRKEPLLLKVLARY